MSLSLKVSNEDIKISSPIIEIVPTTPEHLRELAKTLRPEDEAEILAFGLTPEKALWRAFKSATIRKTAFIDGRIAAMWGCIGTFMGHTGRPFLLTSSEVHKISPLKFARIYLAEVKEMLTSYDKLSSIVDANHSAAIRLLGIVGFELSEPEEMGGYKKMFRRFSMEGLCQI